MKIWLPIIVNLVLFLVALAGIFAGRKNKLLEIPRLICLLCLGIGCYFLNPLFISFIEKTNIVKYFGALSIETIKSFSFGVIFLIGYILISIIFALIKLGIDRKVNGTSKIKVKGTDKKLTKQLQENSLEITDRHIKCKRIIGMILGFLASLVIVIVMSFILKYLFIDLHIAFGYEYTLFGLLDKVFEISKIIL